MKQGDVENIIYALLQNGKVCNICKARFNLDPDKCKCKNDVQCARLFLKMWKLKYGKRRI